MTRPQDDPLGAKPHLPTPRGAGAQRGYDLFRYFLDIERRRKRGGSDPPRQSMAPAMPRGGGRCYDRALAVIAAAVQRAPDEAAEHDEAAWSAGDPPEPDEDPTRPGVDEERTAVGPSRLLGDDALPARPPPGAPMVRPSAPPQPGPVAVPQDLLENTAQSALLMTDPDGTSSFEVAFRDDVFRDVSCRISVRAGGRVVATFRVLDANTRRLLEAEAGRLRAKLEARGLRVDAIDVEVG